jgi:outer membrane protein
MKLTVASAGNGAQLCEGLLFTIRIVKFVSVGLLLAAWSLEAQVAPAPPTPQNSASVTLTLADAITRAKANSPQFQAAITELGLAREDRVQARAALLPSVNYGTSFIYTQPNGLPSGVFIANNGAHEYISQGIAHEALGFGSVPDYQRAKAAHALAQARAEIAARGLVVTVVQAFYGLLAAQAKTVSTSQSAGEAQHFLDLSKKLEAGGEVAHSDVVKAQIQANDLQRQLQDTKLVEENARLAIAVLVFPNFFQDFTLVDDLAAAPALPALPDVQAMAKNNNPELHAAFAALEVADKQVTVARAGHLPSLTVDWFYGIDANQYAIYDRNGFRNLGYSAVASLTLPVFSWGATQSKVKQAELQRHQAQVELSAAQRQALADLQSFYAEGQTSRGQQDILRSSAELAAESLRLTNLRYQAGEASALEVVDAQNTLTAARNAYHDGEARYHLAIANLQTLTGAF